MPDRNTGTVFKLPEMNYCLIIMVITHASGIQGFNRICQANQTMFIQKGDRATFNMTKIILVRSSISLYRADKGYSLMTLYFMSSNISNKDAYYLHPSIENRTLVAGNFDSLARTLSNFIIQIKSIDMADNGTYYYRFYDIDYRTTIFCWIIFVIEIKQQPIGDIGESEAVRIVAEPKSSLLVRPLVIATAVWLFDGRNINQTERFLVQDGAVWAPNLQRTFHDKTVTYRVLQENGQVADVNITLMIRYGPDWPLSIYPEKTYYSLSSGDIMPDISCHTECYPPCSVTWGQHSSDHILRLNQVSESSTGEYTCTATASKGEDGTTNIVTRTICVNVIDDVAFTAGLAVVASVQGITTLILVICGVCFCVRAKGDKRCECVRRNLLMCPCREAAKHYESETNTKHKKFTEMKNYEDLDDGTRCVSSISNTYSKVMSEAFTTDKTGKELEIYENTAI